MWGKFYWVVLGVLLLSLSASSAFMLPQHSAPELDSAVTITVNRSGASDPQVFFKKIYAPNFTSYDLSSVTTRYTATIPGTAIDEVGVYVYYFQDGATRFPAEGYLSFSVTNPSSEAQNASRDLLAADTASAVMCHPNNGNYSCYWEHMQFLEAEAFARNYWKTNNQQNLTVVQNLLNSSIYNLSVITQLCDHTRGDYNCSAYTSLGYYSAGALRQGHAISSLARIAMYAPNTTALSLAQNYAAGVAGECNVHAGDTDCTCTGSGTGSYPCVSADNQGAMILGYTDLYLATGNASYLSIASDLVSDAASMQSSGLLLQGLARYALVANTSTTTLVQRAQSLAPTCLDNSCHAQTKANLMRGLVQTYETTGLPFLLSQMALTSGINASGCFALASETNCATSEEQALLTLAWDESLQVIEELDWLHGITINESFSESGENILYFAASGVLQRPQMVWTDSSGVSGVLNLTENYFNLTGFGIDRYSFYVNSSVGQVSTPYWYFYIPETDELLNSTLDAFAQDDPQEDCDPYGTDGSISDFSCIREQNQGFIIEGLLSYYPFASNQATLRSLIDSLTGVEIDDEKTFQESTCEYLDGDYQCDFVAPYAADPFKVRGGIRQAKMIDGFLSSYSLLYGPEDYYYAKRYLQNPSRVNSGTIECGLSVQDYSCLAASQGHVALAYWNAYERTGKTQYRNAALNFTEEILSYDNSSFTPEAATALWTAYKHTGSSSYQTKATNITDYFEESCIVGSCTTRRLAAVNKMLWTAIALNQSTYFDSAYSSSLLVSPSNTGSCNPSTSASSCRKPDEQGAFVSALSLAKSSYLIPGNKTYAVNITGPSLVNYESTQNFTCVITDTANLTTSFEVFFISPFDVQSVDTTGSVLNNGRSVRFSSVPAFDSRNATWTVTTDFSGPATTRCAVSNFQNATTTTVENISNVLNVSSTRQFSRENQQQTLNFSLINLEDFDLTNVTVNVSTNATVSGVWFANNFSGLQPATITKLLANQTIEGRVNITSATIGNISVHLQLDTAYGGATTSNLSWYVYNESSFGFNDTGNTSAELSSSQIISFTIENRENISLENISVSLQPSQRLIVSSRQSFGENISQINLTHANISKFSGAYVFNWTVYSDTLQDQNYTVLFNSSNYAYTTPVRSFAVRDNILSLNGTLSPSSYTEGSSAQATLTVQAESNATFNLTNVTILPVFSGVGFRNSSATRFFNTSEQASFDATFNSSDVTANIATNDGVFLNITGINVSTYVNISPNVSEILAWQLLNQTEGNFTITLTNGSTSCVSSCALAGDFNLTIVGNGTFLLDQLIVNYTLQQNETLGVVDNQSIRFTTIAANQTMYGVWNVTLSSATLFQVNVTSNEGLFRQLNFSITEIESQESSSSGGGGGGGSGVGRLRYSYLQYNYSNYSYCDYVQDCNQTIANYTHTLTPFLNVTRIINLTQTQTLYLINQSYGGVCYFTDIFNGTVDSSSRSYTQEEGMVQFALLPNVQVEFWYNASEDIYTRPVIRCVPPEAVLEDNSEVEILVNETELEQQTQMNESVQVQLFNGTSLSVRELYGVVTRSVQQNQMTLIVLLAIVAGIGFLVLAKKRAWFSGLQYMSFSFSGVKHFYRRTVLGMKEKWEYERLALNTKLKEDILLEKSVLLAAPREAFDFSRGKTVHDLLGEVYYREKKLLHTHDFTKDVLYELGIGIAQILTRADDVENKKELQTFMKYTLHFAEYGEQVAPEHALLFQEMHKICSQYFRTPEVIQKSARKLAIEPKLTPVAYDAELLYIDMKRLLYHAEQQHKEEVSALYKQITEHISLIDSLPARKKDIFQELLTRVRKAIIAVEKKTTEK